MFHRSLAVMAAIGLVPAALAPASAQTLDITVVGGPAARRHLRRHLQGQGRAGHRQAPRRERQGVQHQVDPRLCLHPRQVQRGLRDGRGRNRRRRADPQELRAVEPAARGLRRSHALLRHHARADRVHRRQAARDGSRAQPGLREAQPAVHHQRRERFDAPVHQVPGDQGRGSQEPQAGVERNLRAVAPRHRRGHRRFLDEPVLHQHQERGFTKVTRSGSS